ncbi:MAG: bifunctional precorrin-2 dehydrogenase/sirohydrochlorin ferrochelatase [Chthonomonadetes bacterium]|nr:bifunctional precorrin-2 dehydrogenase/sirohydrochlorin ferrochelatase [Chthonomonadetes bacterium]
MGYYPVFLDLQARDCLVIGGGKVATEKVRALLDAGARVTVIAPEATERIQHWHQQGVLHWVRRRCQPEDMHGRFLVIAATDDPALHRQLYEWAHSQNHLFNAVDEPEHCNFITPAIASSGPVQIAVSTSGCSPLLAQRLRDQIRHQILSEAIGLLAQFLGERRALVKKHMTGYERRQRFWQKVLDSGVPELLERNQQEQAHTVFMNLVREETSSGYGDR